MTVKPASLKQLQEILTLTGMGEDARVVNAADGLRLAVSAAVDVSVMTSEDAFLFIAEHSTPANLPEMTRERRRVEMTAREKVLAALKSFGQLGATKYDLIQFGCGAKSTIANVLAELLAEGLIEQAGTLGRAKEWRLTS